MDPSSPLPPPPPEKRRRIDRVTAACDLCKARKVKCDGNHPCVYCQSRNRADGCSFSAPKQRDRAVVGTQSATHTPANAPTSPRREGTRNDLLLNRPVSLQADGAETGHSRSPTVSREDYHEDTDVPLEARLLRDAQGKAIFIGDCAPLSFLQTVRHLVASEIDAGDFPLQISRDSVIEVTKPALHAYQPALGLSVLSLDEVVTLVSAYMITTSGILDLFDREQLFTDIKAWANGSLPPGDVTSAVFYLVAAIGIQESDEVKAEAWSAHARNVLQSQVCSSMTLSTVRGFALLSVYMLRAFQPNGAYIYFSLAARTAYAIGLHRTEVNASFGTVAHDLRDRTWKSLRVVDMLVSTFLGRPPSTSDVDCTVKYTASVASPSQDVLDLLDPSVQIFMIIERIVVEVYSRKRISLRIASFVSHQLKGWASEWLSKLTAIISEPASHGQETVVGACQTACSYFYGIMLLTRPFLIYELYEYLGAVMRAAGTRAENQEKRKFADAALDAASAFVEMVNNVIASGKMPLRMPLVVAWLFTASLVLAVGVLGRCGMAFEDACQNSLFCLDYFANVDPHAQQYSIIVRALLKTTTEHVRHREAHFKMQRRQVSSQLFGLLPLDERHQEKTAEGNDDELAPQPVSGQDSGVPATEGIPDWTMYDADFFALPWTAENDQGLQDFLQPGRHTLEGALADVPLFPLYDQTGERAPRNTRLGG